MPTFSPHRFTNSAFLKKTAPANLISFLTSTEAIKTYLANRGFVPPTEGAGGINYDTLIGILADPDTGMPKELVDGLYFVHEMSTPEIMEELLEEAGVLVTCEPGVDPTPADVAIQVWLKDRDLLERKHSEQFLIRPKSFVYYQGAKGEPREAPVLSDFARADMEGEMDEWFERKRRGKGTRVFVHRRDGEVWFLVRHGEPIRREGALEDGKSSSVYYRPEKFDVVIYNCELDGLAVNAGTKGQKKLYKETFGKYLFGDEKYFGDGGRYSLDPLRTRGEEALDCSTVSGIEWIRLKEVEIFHGSGLTVVYKATDLFQKLGARAMEVLASGFLRKASFTVRFTDAATPRSVNIWQPSRASYMRDADRLLVEAWMREQGFLIIAAEITDEEAAAAVVGV